jgi:hypothetical protein
MKSSSEICIRFSGRKNVDKPGVLLFPEISVCLDCGAASFAVTPSKSRILRESAAISSPALCSVHARTLAKGPANKADRILGRRFRRVLVANGCHSADLFHATEHTSGNIGTARVVAEIFC